MTNTELKIGEYNDLTIVEEKPFGLLLDIGDKNILLPTKYKPATWEIGEKINVFVYTDSDDRLIATTQKPLAIVGEFAGLKVVDVNEHGAFLDWGLEKDLFLPFARQLDPVSSGQYVVVRILLDTVSQRVIATSKFKVYLDKDVSALNEGKKVSALIYELTYNGYKVIIDSLYRGIIYKNETFEPLRVGSSTDAFIKKIRSDGLIDLSIQKSGYSGVKSKLPDILSMLEEAGGFLPYHDKSDPELIRRVFKMSKKTFKKGIGTLKKNGKIEIKDNGIRLL